MGRRKGGSWGFLGRSRGGMVWAGSGAVLGLNHAPPGGSETHRWAAVHRGPTFWSPWPGASWVLKRQMGCWLDDIVPRADTFAGKHCPPSDERHQLPRRTRPKWQRGQNDMCFGARNAPLPTVRKNWPGITYSRNKPPFYEGRSIFIFFQIITTI